MHKGYLPYWGRRTQAKTPMTGEEQLRDLIARLHDEIAVLKNENSKLHDTVFECINKIKELKEIGIDDANV